MARSVFYGFGATVGSITGPTSCGWWPDDPALLNWDPAKQIPVDLGKNPEAARRGLIRVDEIQADDFAGYAHGGFTEIGPMWPGGRMTGACYLESTYWNGLGAGKPDRIARGLQARAYELTTVLYWDGPLAGRRFVGFYAEIQQVQGPRALAAIWAPGTSLVPGKAPHGVFWIDFPANVHAIEPDFTEIGVGPADPRAGALFLDASVASALAAPRSKSPIWYGGGGRVRARQP